MNEVRTVPDLSGKGHHGTLVENGWPSPEVPYREDVRFVSREDQRFVDGKVYCPTLLRLKLDKHEACQVIQQLANQLEDGTVREITLHGQITELDDEE